MFDVIGDNLSVCSITKNKLTSDCFVLYKTFSVNTNSTIGDIVKYKLSEMVEFCQGVYRLDKDMQGKQQKNRVPGTSIRPARHFDSKALCDMKTVFALFIRKVLDFQLPN